MALSSRKSQHLASGIGLVLTVLILAMQFGLVPGLDSLYQRLELFVYNQRMQAHLPEHIEPDRRIVIVDIDETSLREAGRWPWSRHRVAELVERLRDAGAVVIAFDVMFAEAERNPADEILNRLNQEMRDSPLKENLKALAPTLDADAVLAQQLAGSEVILGYTFNPGSQTVSGLLPPALSLSDSTSVDLLALPAALGYTAPVPLLQRAAAGGGFFSIRPDVDGVIRRAPLISRYDGKLYGSLALETVRRYLFLQQLKLNTAVINGREHIEFIRMDNSVRIPTDGYGRMLIPFRGGTGSFPYVPAHEVLAGSASAEIFTGAIVLVGTTAAGLFDLRATPLEPVYPGVEVHANLIAAMLDNHYLVVPAWADGANLVFGLVVGMLMAMVMPRLPLIWLIVLTTVTAGSVMTLTSWFWRHYGLVLDLTGPLLLTTVLAVGNLAWGFFFESLTRHRLKDMFGQYVPPELVDEMSERPDEFDVEGKARELSVLFADIRGFTTISESLSADELKRFLNRFFTPMTQVIFNHHGTIDKYVGDMVMAFWGAPVKDEQHALHAIDAALDMQAAARRLKAEFVAAGWPGVNIGIGINSGLMSVGDMGSEYRRTYTVLGDAVNLASRLEGTTKYYGVDLVVGEHTRELAGEYFVYRELDRVQVKGKAQAIRVFQPVCRRKEAEPRLLEEIALLDSALTAFRGRQWEQAEELFSQLRIMQPQLRLYSVYSERIAELRTCNLDESWNGVYVRNEK
jgi:adenylate cyclase